MDYQIEPLATHPELIPLLAQWQHQEWQHLNPPSYDLQSRIEEYQQAISTSGLPVMLVAHHNGQALGSIRLIENDMASHPELGPWLASLYVHPDFRGQGIAMHLISEIENVARQLGFQHIYLYTEDRQLMYQRLGWQKQFSEHYYNKEVEVMTKVL